MVTTPQRRTFPLIFLCVCICKHLTSFLGLEDPLPRWLIPMVLGRTPGPLLTWAEGFSSLCIGLSMGPECSYEMASGSTRGSDLREPQYLIMP